MLLPSSSLIVRQPRPIAPHRGLGFTFCYIPQGAPRDLVTGALGTRTGVTFGSSILGFHDLVSTTDASANKLQWAANPAWLVGSAWSMGILVKRAGSVTGAFRRMFNQTNTNSANEVGIMTSGSASTNGPYGFFYNTSGTQSNTSLTTAILSSSQYEYLILSLGGGTLTLFRNGAVESSVAATGTKAASTVALTIGTDSTGVAAGGPDSVALAWLRNRPTTREEAFLWNARPWIIFPDPEPSVIVGITSGGFTGSISTGSLLKTGKIPNSTINYRFIAATSSLLKTGQIPSRVTGFQFHPSTASIPKTGQVPTLTRAFHFMPGTASLIKTGQVPTMTIKFSFTPGTGSLVKTGHVLDLFAPMHPTTGSIVKTGQVPVLTISGGALAALRHSWFVKHIGVKTKIGVNSQVDSDTGDTP